MSSLEYIQKAIQANLEQKLLQNTDGNLSLEDVNIEQLPEIPSLSDGSGGGFVLQNTDPTKVGYFYNFGSVISSKPLVLPSGGTWWYRIFWCNSSGQSYATNSWYTNNKNIFGGVVAGGTSIQNGNYYGNGFAIKIQ